MHEFLAWARSNRLALLVFFSMGGVYFFTNFQRVAVPGTVFDEIRTDFGTSATAVTALAAIFLYVYAGMQVFIGAGADRFGPARMILVGGALLATGSILFPLSTSITTLYLSRALVGLGASFMYLSIVKEVVNIFDAKHFPPLLGVLLVVGYSGGLAATAPLERLVARFGWRASFLGAGIVCAVVYVFVAALLKAAGRIAHKGNRISMGDLGRLFRTRSIYPLLVCGPINFSMYYVLQITVGKKFLSDYCGLSSRSAANVTFAMLAIVVSGSLVGGFLPRLVGNRRKPFVIITSVGVLAGCAGLAAGMMTRAGASWFVACYLVLAATNASAIMGTALIKEVSPTATAAFAIGVLNAATYLWIAVASNASGLVLDAFDASALHTETAVIYPPRAYTAIFAGMAAFSVLSVAAALFAPETLGVARVDEPVEGGA